MRNLRMAGVALLLALTIIFPGCKKELKQHNALDSISIAEARQFFEQTFGQSIPTTSNPRLGQAKGPDWSAAYVHQSPTGTTIIVPVKHKEGSYLYSKTGKYYFPLDSLTKLFVYKDIDGNLKATRITYLPDDDYIENDRPYAGLVIAEEWNGRKLATYQKLPTGELLVEKPGSGQPTNTRTECFTFYGHNYSEDDPEGYTYSQTYCTFAPNYGDLQPKEYSKAIDPLPRGGGGTGTQPILGAKPTVTVLSGNNPITNVKTYFNCFDNIPGNTNQYQLSIAVIQPDPGTREPWEFSPSFDRLNPFAVGHTYLILTQIGPTQTTIRNVGFYPRDNVRPTSPISPGMLNNDQYKSFHVKLSVSMTSSQFFNVLGYITGSESATYDLNSYNCTTFALEALWAAGIRFESALGSWVGGGGHNPGDLGEDIRKFAPTSNMKTSTIYGKHENQGYCY